MRINTCFWIRTNNNKHYYVFNPYLKTAKHCLETINIINKTNYKLKDVKFWFESI